MDKLTEAQQIMGQHKTLSKNLDRALNHEGFDNSIYDKSTFRLSIGGETKLPWTQGFSLRFGYGTYGNSSFYGDNNEFSAKYFVEAVNSLKEEIAERMKQFSKRDADKKLFEAKEQAESVIEQISA